MAPGCSATSACRASIACSGTPTISAPASAGPSRLIHGGIKYLETGEFRLVAQSTLERNLLLKNAPHYVKPIETVPPIPSWFGGILPSAIRFFGGQAKLKDPRRVHHQSRAGDVRLLRPTPPWHAAPQRHPAERHQKAFPDMADWVVGTATYYDARITHAERLGLELLLDGIAAQPGSRALNHVALSGQDNGVLVFTERITGAVHRVTTDVVVNAAGAWIDKASAALGLSTRYIAATRDRTSSSTIRASCRRSTAR